LRFQSPLVEPDVQISRIRLSDKVRVRSTHRLVTPTVDCRSRTTPDHPSFPSARVSQAVLRYSRRRVEALDLLSLTEPISCGASTSANAPYGEETDTAEHDSAGLWDRLRGNNCDTGRTQKGTARGNYRLHARN